MLMLVTVILVCSCSLQAFGADFDTWMYMMSHKLGPAEAGGGDIRFIPHQDFGALTISHMNEALYVWNQAMDAGYLGREPVIRHSDPETDYPGNGRYDGKSKVYRVHAGTNGTYVAQMTPGEGAGLLTSADIAINMSFQWANSAQPGKYDFWTVFMHEAGHVVGIADNDILPNSVMYGVARLNHTRRSLTDFEYTMLGAIYG